MSTLPTTALPDWQREWLALLLVALDGVPISDAERASLTWLSGWELRTPQNIAAVITRARQSRQAQTATRTPATTPSPAYTELSNAITRALTLIREAGDALTTAGQALAGLSGALADVVAAMAPIPEVPALAARRLIWRADRPPCAQQPGREDSCRTVRCQPRLGRSVHRIGRCSLSLALAPLAEVHTPEVALWGHRRAGLPREVGGVWWTTRKRAQSVSGCA